MSQAQESGSSLTFPDLPWLHAVTLLCVPSPSFALLASRPVPTTGSGAAVAAAAAPEVEAAAAMQAERSEGPSPSFSNMQVGVVACCAGQQAVCKQRSWLPLSVNSAMHACLR